jgi:hypothetical protein
MPRPPVAVVIQVIQSRTAVRSRVQQAAARALPLLKQVIRELVTDTAFWFDNVWLTGSTPVERACSRPTVRRSNLAGWAAYGYCRSHSRCYWGLRLFLVCTRPGCRSPGHWPARRSTNARCCRRCSIANTDHIVSRECSQISLMFRARTLATVVMQYRRVASVGWPSARGLAPGPSVLVMRACAGWPDA